MTDTRKQIIELISDYMDKTLSDGCIVKSHKGIGNFIYLNNFNEIEYISCEKHFCVEHYKCQVIGHYDMTAVLKYIVKYAKNFHITNDKIQWGDIGVDDLGNIYDFQIGETQNKPLHLYTDEEDKDLLKLLKKLGPINNSKEA